MVKVLQLGVARYCVCVEFTVVIRRNSALGEWRITDCACGRVMPGDTSPVENHWQDV
jgi:hypothetical protein